MRRYARLLLPYRSFQTIGSPSFDSRRFLLHAESLRTPARASLRDSPSARGIPPARASLRDSPSARGIPTGIAPLPRYYGLVRLLLSFSLHAVLPSSLAELSEHATLLCPARALAGGFAVAYGDLPSGLRPSAHCVSTAQASSAESCWLHDVRTLATRDFGNETSRERFTSPTLLPHLETYNSLISFQIPAIASSGAIWSQFALALFNRRKKGRAAKTTPSIRTISSLLFARQRLFS